ncbi:hypothetical protein, partial [Enterococcus faecium]
TNKNTPTTSSLLVFFAPPFFAPFPVCSTPLPTHLLFPFPPPPPPSPPLSPSHTQHFSPHPTKPPPHPPPLSSS